jgi:nucleotide-binding universal stress UspA family protein
MTIKTILTALSGAEPDRRRLDASFAVARRFAAHIDALHARGDPRNAVPITVEGMSGALVEDIMRAAERDAAERAQAARATFDRWRADAGATLAERPTDGVEVTASWYEEMGREDDLIARYGRLADLIVESRPTESDFTAETSVEAAIFDTGRPVLLVAPEPGAELGETVAIFWNGSAQAARAVAGALPLLSQATRVHVLWVDEALGPEPAQKGLPDYLAWHGVNASVSKFQPDYRSVGEALLQEADRVGADLLVMGAYTHSRIRQMVLGGVTKHVLGHAAIPVLLAH